MEVQQTLQLQLHVVLAKADNDEVLTEVLGDPVPSMPRMTIRTASSAHDVRTIKTGLLQSSGQW